MRPGALLLLFVAVLGGAAAPLRAEDPPAKPADLRANLDQGKAWIGDKLFGLQVSAFGDFIWARDAETGNGKVAWGAAELDLGLDLLQDLQAAAAVVWTREGSQLTVGFLDYHLFGGRIAPRGRIWGEKGFHIQAGRFDVPFGNDWQFFASKDSVSISRPLSTRLVMDDGYNDEGLRVLGNDGTFNFNFYVLRGFSEGRLYGGRVGVMPFGNPFSLKDVKEGKIAEFGFSALLDRDHEGRKRGSATAWDAEFRGSRVQLRGEYMERRRDAWEETPASTLRGWHVTVEVPLEETLGHPFTLFARYERGSLSPREEGAGDPRDARVATGFSLGLWGVLQVKAEIQRWSEAAASTRGEASYGGTQGFLSLVWVF